MIKKSRMLYFEHLENKNLMVWELGNFEVYALINTIDHPNFQEEKIQDIQLLTEWYFWGEDDNKWEVNVERIKETTKRLDVEKPIVVNIEKWVTTGAEEVVSESVRKLELVVDTIHSVNQDFKVGIYSMLPTLDFWTPAVSDNNSQKFKDWENANIRLKELSEHVDIIFPSLYTYYSDQNLNGSLNLFNRETWIEFATETIAQARMYDKPVIPFIMPIYHGGGGSTDPLSNNYRWWMYQNIGAEFWNIILKTVHKHADSVVIFDYNLLAPNGIEIPRKWDEELEWWDKTKDFIKEINAPKYPVNIIITIIIGPPTNLQIIIIEERTTIIYKGIEKFDDLTNILIDVLKNYKTLIEEN